MKRRVSKGLHRNTEQLKENEGKRVALYKLAAAFLRAYANLANEIREARYSELEAQAIQREVEHYEKVREEVKLASGDYIDMKMYEPAMRHLLDAYIRAEESEKLSAFDDMTLVQLIVERGEEAVESLPEGLRRDREAMAETIENNVRRLIIDEMALPASARLASNTNASPGMPTDLCTKALRGIFSRSPTQRPFAGTLGGCRSSKCRRRLNRRELFEWAEGKTGIGGIQRLRDRMTRSPEKTRKEQVLGLCRIATIGAREDDFSRSFDRSGRWMDRLGVPSLAWMRLAGEE